MSEPEVSGGGQQHRAPDREPDRGGDPACWAHLVCRDCGRFADDPGARVCEACSADLPSADAER